MLYAVVGFTATVCCHGNDDCSIHKPPITKSVSCLSPRLSCEQQFLTTNRAIFEKRMLNGALVVTLWTCYGAL